MSVSIASHFEFMLPTQKDLERSYLLQTKRITKNEYSSNEKLSSTMDLKFSFSECCAVINLTAFLFSGTFSFGHFPLFTRWCLVICQKSLQLYNHWPNHFKCEATVQDNVQGITTLVGRRLGKTLTIKRKAEVWDLAMFMIDTQDKRRRQKMIDLCLLYWYYHSNLNFLVF